MTKLHFPGCKVLSLVLGLALILGACSSASATDTNTTPQSKTSKTTTTTKKPSADNQAEVTGPDYYQSSDNPLR